MKPPPRIHRARRGYISVLMVLSVGTILSLLTIYAYRRASQAQRVQAQIQLRVDYSEKEEAILRSIVAITPNRAIRAMQSGSDVSDTTRNPLRWENIFTESLVLANARTSISPAMVTSLNIPNLRVGNTGDSTLTRAREIFRPISTETGFVSPGTNRTLGTGYPVPQTCTDATTNTRNLLYPIISNQKSYGTLAQAGVGLPVGNYWNYNLLKYPQINFGYTKPGEDFVARRNWWAFSVDVADNDDNATFLARNKRDFVLSIYEIPSQLPISASSYMSLGEYSGGAAWQNITIDGGIFAGKAETKGNTAISALSSRRGMTLSSGTTIGGQSFTNSPFTPGLRESYQITTGAFFPVSLASESGRAAFVPINRGPEFFDRFAHAAESNVLSTTTWNNYTVGAMQAAMQLDIIAVRSSTNPEPTIWRFSAYERGTTTGAQRITSVEGADYATLPGRPLGFTQIAAEGASVNLNNLDGGKPVDLLYGEGTGYTMLRKQIGTIKFDNATFGDPNVGTVKKGFWRPVAKGPFEAKKNGGGQDCMAFYPERLPAFLDAAGGAPVGHSSVAGPFGPGIANSGLAATNTSYAFFNNSVCINVDYTTTGLNNPVRYRPNIPSKDTDFYGVILQECADLRAYTKGFSMVTNLRTYIGDDFNVVATTPPSGYTPLVTTANPTGRYLPPCSIFTPELRYGVEVNPYRVSVGGQIGSLASDSIANPVHPLDTKFRGGAAIAANQITMNLSQIRHPAEVPPIAMMNWLILLEERKREFY